MARINRFYLLIAAFAFTKTVPAMGWSCDETDRQLECYNRFHGPNPDELRYLETKTDPRLDGVCLTWDGWEDGDGNPLPDSVCLEIDDDSLAMGCCDNIEDCWRWLMGYEDCTGGGGSGNEGNEDPYVPTCTSGQYWNLNGTPHTNMGTCETCDAYDYAPGKSFTGVLSSSKRNTNDSTAGSGGNVQYCYVPQGKTFTDTSGTFAYMYDCYYYGAGYGS